MCQVGTPGCVRRGICPSCTPRMRPLPGQALRPRAPGLVGQARSPRMPQALPCPRSCGPAPGHKPSGPRTCPAFPPAPRAQPPSCGRSSPRPPGYLNGSVSGTTAKWLSLPGPLRRTPIGPCPPPPPPPLAGFRSLFTRLARAAAAPRRSRRSRLLGDQVSVRRGCWGLENRAELVEPPKS